MTRRSHWGNIAFYVVLAALLPACGGGAPPALRLSLEAGNTRTISLDQNSTMSITTPMGSMDLDMTQNYRLNAEVTDAPDNGPISVRMTIDRVQLDMGMRMGEMNLRDMMPMGEIFEPIAAAAKGQTFTVKVTPRGEIVSIEDLDGLHQAVKTKAGEMNLPPGMDFGSQVEEMFNETTMKDSVQSVFCYFPEEPITPTHTWSSQQRTETGMPVNVTRNWSVQEQLESFLTVAAESSVESVPGASADLFGPMGGSLNLTGTGKGTVTVDRATGWIVESSETVELAGDISLEGMPGFGGNASVPVTVKSVVQVKSH